MATNVFDFTAEKLEQSTDLDRLEARGTLRLALKAAGLDAGCVSAPQMSVVVQRVLPKELATRGVESAESICDALLRNVKSLASPGDGEPAESPEAIFRRLARG